MSSCGLGSQDSFNPHSTLATCASPSHSTELQAEVRPVSNLEVVLPPKPASQLILTCRNCLETMALRSAHARGAPSTFRTQPEVQALHPWVSWSQPVQHSLNSQGQPTLGPLKRQRWGSLLVLSGGAGGGLRCTVCLTARQADCDARRSVCV